MNIEARVKFRKRLTSSFNFHEHSGTKRFVWICEGRSTNLVSGKKTAHCRNCMLNVQCCSLEILHCFLMGTWPFTREKGRMFALGFQSIWRWDLLILRTSAITGAINPCSVNNNSHHKVSSVFSPQRQHEPPIITMSPLTSSKPGYFHSVVGNHPKAPSTLEATRFCIRRNLSDEQGSQMSGWNYV